jgi:hypothetical protein
LIREHLVKNLTIELDDFDAPIFFQRGGLGKARKVFADDLAVRSNSSKSSGLKSRLGSCPYAPVA